MIGGRGLVGSFIASALAFAANAQTVVDSTLTITPVVPVGTLALPTQIRFLGLRDLLVTEKDTGRIMRVQNGALLPTPALDLAVSQFAAIDFWLRRVPDWRSGSRWA